MASKKYKANERLMTGMQNNPLAGKRVHLIGRMKSKRSIVARMELSGAKHRDKFSSLIDVVVIPDNADAQANTISHTLTAAREMEQRGELTILRESQIENILSGDIH